VSYQIGHCNVASRVTKSLEAPKKGIDVIRKLDRLKSPTRVTDVGKCEQGVTAPVVNITYIILSSSQVQDGDTLESADPGPPGKWALKYRDRDRQTD